MSFPIAILLIALSKNYHAVNALISNTEQSPQLLSDTTTICSAQGRTPTCQVELDVPASCVTNASSSECPIVFFFHGAGGTSNGFARKSAVHSENVIGVYPQGEDGWNTGPKTSNLCGWDEYACTSDPDEGAFIASIIVELRNLNANGNIYLIGNSNGAALSHRLAANAADDLPIKGIVTKVTQLLASPARSGPGELNYNQPGSVGPPVSILNLMGVADGLIPYEGGGSSVFGGDDNFQLMSAMESMATWAAHNGCSSSAPVATTGISFSTNNGPNGEAIFYEYTGCPEGIIVEHYAVAEAGHSLAGGALDATEIDYELAYQFIHRVEAGDSGGGGGPSSTPSPTSSPVQTSCIACTDDPTPWMITAAYDCASAPNWLINTKCNKIDYWINNSFCESSCQAAGFGYHATSCCDGTTPDPTPAPTPSPVQSVDCVDDPDWHGKHNEAHICAYIGEVPITRCGYESTDGTLASVACKEACDACDDDVVGPNPTSSPVHNADCSDDPDWHGKFNEAHTCAYVGEAPTNRCGYENTDGVSALVACKESCGEC